MNGATPAAMSPPLHKGSQSALLAVVQSVDTWLGERFRRLPPPAVAGLARLGAFAKAFRKFSPPLSIVPNRLSL